MMPPNLFDSTALLEARDATVASRIGASFEGAIGMAQDRASMADALVEIREQFHVVAQSFEACQEVGTETALQLQALRRQPPGAAQQPARRGDRLLRRLPEH